LSKPIAPAFGIAFAFPDVCQTPTAGGPVPIPYPNIAQLSDATNVADDVLIGPNEYKALLKDSEVAQSSGDEAGSAGPNMGKCTITQASATVVYGPSSKGIARFSDQTSQNGTNSQGMVLSAFPTVLVND
jgi:hypothetical protein